MSTDFKKMIEIVLQEKPEINAEMVKDLIEEKKKLSAPDTLQTKELFFLLLQT